MKFISLFVLIFSFSLVLNAQKLMINEVPKEITTEFAIRYPEATDVSWSLKNKKYVAEFTFNEKAVIAFYGQNLRWENSEITVSKDDVPRIMWRQITEEFSELEIIKISYLEVLGTQNTYKVEATENGNLRYLHFLNEGVFIKMTDDKGKTLKENNSSKIGFQPIPANDLPATISSYLRVTYPNFKIDEAHNVNNNEYKNAFFVQLMSNTNKDELVKIYFANDGKVLQTIDPTVEIKAQTPIIEETGRRRQRTEVTGIPANMVPKAVVDAFNKRIRRHEELSWDTLKGMYIASFIDPNRNQKNHAEFTPRGIWTRTMVEIDPKTMHQLVQRHLDQNYPELTIHSVSSTTTADKKRYILVKIFDPNWLNDPMVYHELYFTTTGRFENEIYAEYKHPSDLNIGKKDNVSSEKFLSQVDESPTELDVEFKRISTKEMPTNALKHAAKEFPDYRIQDTYILVDDITDEIVYWIILRKEGVRTRTKAIYDFRGRFIEAEDYERQ